MTLIRHVRTSAGSARYGLPIGAPIVAKPSEYVKSRKGKSRREGKGPESWGALEDEFEDTQTFGSGDF